MVAGVIGWSFYWKAKVQIFIEYFGIELEVGRKKKGAGRWKL
jgi:hypothetical protein